MLVTGRFAPILLQKSDAPDGCPSGVRLPNRDFGSAPINGHRPTSLFHEHVRQPLQPLRAQVVTRSAKCLKRSF